MSYIYVKFLTNGKLSYKEYVYHTKLELIKGGIYYIEADNRTTYDNPVEVIEILAHNPIFVHNIREITDAKLLKAPSKPYVGLKNIYINPLKKITVIVWDDGSKTKVKCQDNDIFDYEKGIALCFMKHAYENRGCYNDVFKRIKINANTEIWSLADE